MRELKILTDKTNFAVSSEVDTNFYKPDETTWFKAYPYTFMYSSSSGQFKEFPLPINPSNLTVTTQFATNVISTIYGTVEEHTDVRYFDITIRGTTGFAPRYFAAFEGEIGEGVNSAIEATSVLAKIGNALSGKASGGASIGRKSFQVTGPALGGLFKKTLGAVNSILGQVNSIVGGEKHEDGIVANKSGYIAFHNFYRFLLTYKRAVSTPGGKFFLGDFELGFGTKPSSHPLQFVNYKDGVQYDVAIRNFVLERSAENPMLYYYTIQARGYNIRAAGEKPESSIKILEALGLSGVQGGSTLGKMKKIASKARAAAGSLVGGINTFGR